MRHTAAIVALVLSLAFSTTAFAEDESSGGGFNLAADVGLVKFFDNGPTGFGLTLYPGWALSEAFVLEAELGFSRGEENEVRTRVIPFMFGAQLRIPVGPVRPFVGAHVGISNVSVKTPEVEVFGVGLSISASETKPSLDIGAGVDYMIADSFGVGVALQYDLLFFEEEALDFFSAGAHVSVGF